MKISVFKKAISFLAVAAMLITSTNLVFAANDYATQTTDCSNGTNWGLYTDTGVSATRVNEEIKVERTIFRVKDANKATYQGLENATALSDGYVYFTAGENGNWQAVETESANPTWTYNFADSKSFSKGRVQIKGDIKFDGGATQTASIDFSNSTGVAWERLGVMFGKTGMRPLWPSGTTGAVTNYPETVENGVWYTFTVVYDIDGQTIDYTLQKKNDTAWSATGVAAIPSTVWTATREKGKVRGMTFATYRDYDTADATSADYKSSVWYLDNVELDAYTETNYKLENVYKNGRGFITNKYLEKTAAIDQYSLQGINVNRFTGVKDPAGASLVTASYDGDNRFVDATVTSLSSIGTAPVSQEVEEGSTVKTFIMDMNNARPYGTVYQYADPTNVYRLLDFSGSVNNSYDGYDSIKNGDRWCKVTTAGTAYQNGVEMSKDDNALKIERSIFGDSTNGYVTYDETEGKVVTTTTKTHNNFAGVAIGANVSKVTTSLRFKFAGVDHTSGAQEIDIQAIGSGTRFLRITREDDGKGRLWAYFQGVGSGTTVARWNENDTRRMRANEWYELAFTYDITTKQLTAYIKGVFDNTGYEEIGGTTTISDFPDVTSMNMILVGIPHDMSMAFPASEATTATTFKTKTSVVHIDDLKIEYNTSDIVQ